MPVCVCAECVRKIHVSIRTGGNIGESIMMTWIRKSCSRLTLDPAIRTHAHSHAFRYCVYVYAHRYYVYARLEVGNGNGICFVWPADVFSILSPFPFLFFLFPISIAVLLQFASSPVSFALSPASCFSALCSVFSLSCRWIVQSAAFGWNICKVLLDTQSPFPAHSHLPARFTTIRGIYVRIYENGLVVVPVHRPLPRR